TGWARYNVDGGGTQWERYSRGYMDPGAARHGPFPTMQDGWLVTPPIPLPVSNNLRLRFWERTAGVSAYYKHSLWVCTSGCTSPPNNYTQLAEFGTPTTKWRVQVVDLSAYAGQTVYLAFRYQGANADTWYIDNVSVLDASGCAYPTGTRILVRDQWDSAAPHTDIDTIVFGPTPTSLGSGWYDEPEPDYFGPYVLDTVAKSPNANTSNGIWRFNTSSGANEDWVNAPFPDWRADRGGLHAFLQHNVLYEGDRFDVVFTKTVGTLVEDIHSFNINTYVDAGLVGTATLTATLDLNGLVAEGFLIAPETTTWANEPLDFTGEGTIEWTYVFPVSSAYYLEIWTSSADVADLDLYLYRRVGTAWQRVASSAG
ncbi:MAG: choice-of-anchor J domain-containing protein, partial [Anaerolineae bacterium]